MIQVAPGMADRTIANPELMTSASSMKEPTDWAITSVLQMQASSRKSDERERMAVRQIR